MGRLADMSPDGRWVAALDGDALWVEDALDGSARCVREGVVGPFALDGAAAWIAGDRGLARIALDGAADRDPVITAAVKVLEHR